MEKDPKDEDYWEFDEKAFDEEDELDKEAAAPRWPRLRLIIVSLLSLAVLIQLVSFWPTVYNLQAIQFLEKSLALYQNEDVRGYKEAVVAISSEGRKGTGFHIGQGLIVTNHHVIEGAQTALVTFADRTNAYNAAVVLDKDSIDIAILQLASGDQEDSDPIAQLAFLPLADTPWEAGMHITLIGNPLSFFHIANEGTVDGTTQLQGWDIPVLTLDAPVFKGNSGSPVINNEGEAIAVVFATIELDNKKMGLAVPVDAFAEDLAQLMKP